MSQHESLAQRLAVLKQRIDRAEGRLRLKLFLHQEEQATLEVFRTRYAAFEQQLNEQPAGSAGEGPHFDTFEKTVQWWISSLKFDR